MSYPTTRFVTFLCHRSAGPFCAACLFPVVGLGNPRRLRFVLLLGNARRGSNSRNPVLLYDLARQRRVTAFAEIAVAIYLSLWLLQGYIIGLGEASYLNDRSLMLRQVIHNLDAYAQIVGAFWLGSSRNIL